MRLGRKRPAAVQERERSRVCQPMTDIITTYGLSCPMCRAALKYHYAPDYSPAFLSVSAPMLKELEGSLQPLTMRDTIREYGCLIDRYCRRSRRTMSLAQTRAVTRMLSSPHALYANDAASIRMNLHLSCFSCRQSSVVQAAEDVSSDSDMTWRYGYWTQTVKQADLIKNYNPLWVQIDEQARQTLKHLVGDVLGSTRVPIVMREVDPHQTMVHLTDGTVMSLLQHTIYVQEDSKEFVRQFPQLQLDYQTLMDCLDRGIKNVAEKRCETERQRQSQQEKVAEVATAIYRIVKHRKRLSLTLTRLDADLLLRCRFVLNQDLWRKGLAAALKTYRDLSMEHEGESLSKGESFLVCSW